MAGKRGQRDRYVFIVRLWREPEAAAVWRGSVETIPGGSLRYFADLSQLTAALLNPATLVGSVPTLSEPITEPAPGKQ